MLGYLLLSGITTGALYALIALGIAIVFKASGGVNLAHGDMFWCRGSSPTRCTWPGTFPTC